MTGPTAGGPVPTQARAEPSVTARPAATVALLRDAATGFEVWLMRRVAQMAFAAGMTVFPGGRVEPQDRVADVPWIGRAPASRHPASAAEARAAMIAAVRETFEETGVLLTRPPHAEVDDDGGRLTDERRRVEAGELPFGRLLAGRGLAVDAGLIRPWARWITPALESRRYDTWFYVAALPTGSHARMVTSEAHQADWLRPADALAEHQAGRRPMLPPTVVTLQELAGFGRVDDVLAAAEGRPLDPVEPHIGVAADGGRAVILPDGRAFRLG